MGDSGNLPAGKSSPAEITAFLRQLGTVPRSTTGRRGRLMFGMDATASREPAWDRACQLQGEMFEATAALGGLDIQLVFFRGYGECKAAPWLASAPELLRRMSAVRCLAGQTQWCRVLSHAIAETGRERVNALVAVGDCMEENIDHLGDLAGQLGVLGVPAFLFQEGDDPTARRAFQQVARLTGGAWCPFDAASARQLKELLSAVAVFAAGGRAALEDLGHSRGGLVQRLTDQMARPGTRPNQP
jgi:hypothetical protein